MSLIGVGFDGEIMDASLFIKMQQGLNQFQKCAKIFNENDAIPKLISTWYNGTTRHRYIMTIPKTLNCNGMDYPYSLQISDGRITTTINGYYFTNGFTEGIATQEMSIPAEDVEKGVYVYVDRVGPFKLRHSYELRDKSDVAFDAAAGSLISDYSIQVVPSLVWNCKFVNAGTKATGELNGTFMPGSEEIALKTFACIFNNGMPEDICSQVGIVRDENGSISAGIPAEYYLTMYETGLESCKEGDVTKLEVFYAIDCPDCINQRRILEKVAQDLDEYLDVTYYCADDSEACEALIAANA
jgi:hypothetical protein